MDRMCVKFTGHSSAYGLIKAEQIDREVSGRAAAPAKA
jgi:hypothetical protein